MFLPNIILFNFHKSSASGGGGQWIRKKISFLSKRKVRLREK